MFIKEIRKRNKGYEKEFIQYRLMESYRTERGPRQRTVLHLGYLELDGTDLKKLADRIEEKLSGQESLFGGVGEEVERLAGHYAALIKREKLEQTSGGEEGIGEQRQSYESVDLNSVETSEVRTIGAEYVGFKCYEELKIDEFLASKGISKKRREECAASVIGRLVNPGSEKRTREWLKELSGLGELLGCDFRHLSNNALYRASDLLLEHKQELESHLVYCERELFCLEERIVLYDLTNSYFEGRAATQEKAKHGRSKEKRSDCPLLTLGLVLDEQGFAKRSEVLEGNISEPKTLVSMLDKLNAEEKSEKKRTVVVDAGIATEENLKMLRERGYDYVCVSRSRATIKLAGEEGVSLIKKKGDNILEARLIKKENESLLHCRSTLRLAKEQQIKQREQDAYEKRLQHIAASLNKKGGVKKYEKVLERLARVKERFSSIAQYYQVKVQKHEEIAQSIEWTCNNEQLEQRFSGEYIIRTSRNDLTEKQIWSLYVMLNNVEAAFRSLKHELNLRPIFHVKQERSDAHLFIAVLAYHLLHAIQVKLHAKGIKLLWETIRQRLASHVRVTTEMNTQKKQRLAIRHCSLPEHFHLSIYQALGLPLKPLPVKRTVL